MAGLYLSQVTKAFEPKLEERTFSSLCVLVLQQIPLVCQLWSRFGLEICQKIPTGYGDAHVPLSISFERSHVVDRGPLS